MKSTRLLLTILAMTMSLGGCGTASFNAPPTVKVVCPAIQPYDSATQTKLADEFDALPAKSTLRRAVGDYLNLRNQVRACNKDKVNG